MKSLSLFAATLWIAVSINANVGRAAEGDPFQVQGEQLVHAPPSGWKLAWMSGEPGGSYTVEYISGTEDIQAWREGYLQIARNPYPAEELLKELARRKTSISALAIYQDADQAKKRCAGAYTPMSMATNVSNGVTYSVGGGFCDKYGPAAPFGEGALVGFFEGKDYLFKVQYGWRPKSPGDKKESPWRIYPDTSKHYLDAITQSTLCGASGQPSCSTVYAR